jgi:hypothetical protein
MDKKGVSVMIGYILLVVTAISMSVVVYAWLRTYIPKDIPGCPEEVSILVTESACVDGNLSIRLQNNGRFGIDAFYIRATTSPDTKIATKNLAEKDFINFAEIDVDKVLKPNEESEIINFNLDSGIYAIEITPVRFEKINNKLTFTPCGQSAVFEKTPVECQTI